MTAPYPSLRRKQRAKQEPKPYDPKEFDGSNDVFDEREGPA
jgi:hypothetical protein